MSAPIGATPDPSGSVVQHIRALAPTLAPAERRIADAIVEHPNVVMSKTITQLAAQAQTSETTVVRFCRRAGFSGYPELRLAVASELGGGKPNNDRFAPGTDI